MNKRRPRLLSSCSVGVFRSFAVFFVAGKASATPTNRDVRDDSVVMILVTVWLVDTAYSYRSKRGRRVGHKPLALHLPI